MEEYSTSFFDSYVIIIVSYMVKNLRIGVDANPRQMANKFKQTKKLFFSAGIPIAIGTSLISYFYYKDPLNAVIIGLTGLLAVGALLSLLGSVFLHFPRFVWKATVAHFLLLPLIGLILTGFYFELAWLAPQGHWIQVEPPPEKAERFLQSSDPSLFGSTIYIQTKSGKTYIYDCVNYQGCNWVESEYKLPQEEDSFCPEDEKPKPFIAPLAPKGAIDTYQSLGCGVDFGIQIKYLLVGDGRIFAWYRYWSVYEIIFGPVGFALVGFIAGMTTSIATFLMRSQRKPVDATATPTTV